MSIFCSPLSPGLWRSAPLTWRMWPRGSGEDLGHPEGREVQNRGGWEHLLTQPGGHKLLGQPGRRGDLGYVQAFCPEAQEENTDLRLRCITKFTLQEPRGGGGRAGLD